MKKESADAIIARLAAIKSKAAGAVLWSSVLSSVVVRLFETKGEFGSDDIVAQLRSIAEDETNETLIREAAAEAIYKLTMHSPD